jgi:hypothetical protein
MGKKAGILSWKPLLRSFVAKQIRAMFVKEQRRKRTPKEFIEEMELEMQSEAKSLWMLAMVVGFSKVAIS